MTQTQTPVISIGATERPIEWVELVGERYAVRRPKSVVEADPKGKILKTIAYLHQDSPNRADRRKNNDAERERLELTGDDIEAGMEAIWRYLQLALDDSADYAAIRRRVYGPDISDEDAESCAYLHCDEDPNPDDPIDSSNVMALVGNLMVHWSGHDETVKTNVKAPPRPVKKTSAGTTTKRPAKRPAKLKR